MVNAGRILIIAKGAWNNLTSYEQLDLVTLDGIAYLARRASVGENPSQDTQMTYWQPFGSAADIATTSEPGIVMPDGVTIKIDQTGLIKANVGELTVKNLATGATSVTFTDIPTTGDYIFDFYTSTGINYKAIDLSTPGEITLTFNAQAADVLVYCKKMEA